MGEIKSSGSRMPADEEACTFWKAGAQRNCWHCRAGGRGIKRSQRRGKKRVQAEAYPEVASRQSCQQETCITCNRGYTRNSKLALVERVLRGRFVEKYAVAYLWVQRK